MLLWIIKVVSVDLEKLVNRFINILIVWLLAMPLLAQVDSLAVVSADTVVVEDVPAPVIEYTMQRKTYEIADIKITGADGYEDFVLIGFSGLAVGDKVEVPGDKITKSLKRFWKQGLFSDVKFKATKIEGDKIWLEIVLQQRPRVSEVAYNGLRKTEQEDLEVKVGIQKGGQMTPDLADRAKKVTMKYLKEKGYHNATVQVLQFNDMNHPGYVKVAVNVDKKDKTRVGQIYITGNEALTHNQLNRAMKKTNDNHILNLFQTKKFVAEELGFIAPFDTFTSDDVPNDPLAKEVLAYIQSDGVKNLPWHFSVIPSLRFKEDFGASLLAYAQGKKSFADVVSDVKRIWKSESAHK